MRRDWFKLKTTWNIHKRFTERLLRTGKPPYLKTKKSGEHALKLNGLTVSVDREHHVRVSLLHDNEVMAWIETDVPLLIDKGDTLTIKGLDIRIDVAITT